MLGTLRSGLVWDTFFCILTSLAYGGVMGKLGTIVMLPGCGDSVIVSRLMGAPPGEMSVFNVYLGHVTVLTCCGRWGALILRFQFVGALWPSSSCSRPRLSRLCEVLCCR